MSIDITALIKRAIRQAGMRSRRASMTQSSSPARPGRRRAAAWAAWPAAGIVLVLMAAIAPAAYAATGTAPPAPAPRTAVRRRAGPWARVSRTGAAVGPAACCQGSDL